MAMRLSRYFVTTARLWINLQADFDLETEEDRIGSKLKKEVIVLEREAAAA